MSDPFIAKLSLFSRVLGIYTAASIQKPCLSPRSPTFCVAPSAVFPDYDRVIASLNGEQEAVSSEEDDDAETMGDLFHMSEQLQGDRYRRIKHDDTACRGSDSECDFLNIAEDLDEFDGVEEDHEIQRPRVHHVYAALDISNTYASRSPLIPKSTRRSGRPKPYECKQDNLTASVLTRCSYVSPDDGTRCRKINKTPQEGGRHWRSCHLYKEAKEMLTGVLAVGKGTAITSEAQLMEVMPLIQCSLCSALITRSDAMRRHLRTNCRAGEDTEHIQNDGLRRKKPRKRLT